MISTRGFAGLFVASLLLPTLALAQTALPLPSGPDSQLIVILEQLVTELQQELQQLIALHQSPSFPRVPSNNPTPTSTPFSITAPTCTLSLTSLPGTGFFTAGGVLSWTSTNATTGTIAPGVGTVGPSGSQFVSELAQSITWTGSFTGAGGVATCTTTYTASGNPGGGSSASFTATPTSGTAPLSVTFSASGADAGLSVSFGDGSASQTLSQTSCTNSVPPSCVSGVTHTYTSAGFYIVDLKNSLGTVVNVETILVTAPAGQTPPTTPTTPGGSCVAYTTTYQNGATIWYIGRPGPGVGQVLGQVATQWTCSSGQWVSQLGGAPSQPTSPTSGASCTFQGSTYANGSSVQCTQNPGAGACPLGVPVSSWTCRDGQWISYGTQGTPNTNTTSCTDTQGALVPSGQTGMAYCGGNLLAIECVRTQLCVNGQWQDTSPGTGSCVAMTASQTSTGQNSCGDLYCPNNAASQKYYCQVGGPAGGGTWSSTPCTGKECLTE